MKILHLTSSFYPDSTGGTESYVLHLTQGQMRNGHSVELLRLGTMSNYVYRDLNVNTVEPSKISKIAYYAGLKNHEALENAILETQPDVLYIHDRNPHFSASILAKVKSKLPKCKMIGVYHSAGQSCPNRSLINAQNDVCDGELIAKRCTTCRLTKTKGAFIGQVTNAFSLNSAIANGNPLSELTHANYYTRSYIKAFNMWIDALDTIQYHADWVKDLLLLNGVVEKKLSYVPLESIYDFQMPTTLKNEYNATEKIQVVCAGRCINIKGQLMLLQALENLGADTQEKIDVHFIGPGFDDDNEYAQKVRRKIESLDFVHQPKLLKPEDVALFLKDKHVGVVPTLCPETGPLVILDFLKSGMNVLSTPYIGIKNDAIDYFEFSDVQSLNNALMKVVFRISQKL